ncbi:MAG: Crp/Fnr family transcriptional regulator [Actinobacteria bacterium]|nr:Crp/Fnr family transcriptional regulator [Actinomycetota bacterium]MBU1944366.1 Crp/Fnr family transcriptional regulator [Actinomycetota bacterium]MBU2688165.1 Crp/Fnr family transcriptional regulator [Actinomycetota bacterium]
MTECDCLDQFLSNLKKEKRNRLQDKFISQVLDRGQLIFFEGDPASHLYLVEKGVIEANVIHGDGKVYIFHFVFPGEVFGEGVLYGQEYYPFSTVARKESLVWKAPAHEVRAALDADPGFKSYIIGLLGEKLEQSYIKARCVAGERVEKRVACILLKTIEEFGMHNCKERLDTPLTNRDISGLIGSTEETVSRVMSRMKKEGIIAMEDKQLVVLDREKLLGYFDSM